jgi:hypothetical protein
VATGVASRLASARQAARFVIRWRTAAVAAVVEPKAAARGQHRGYPPCPPALWEIWALVQVTQPTVWIRSLLSFVKRAIYAHPSRTLSAHVGEHNRFY